MLLPNWSISSSISLIFCWRSIYLSVKLTDTLHSASAIFREKYSRPSSRVRWELYWQCGWHSAVSAESSPQPQQTSARCREWTENLYPSYSVSQYYCLASYFFWSHLNAKKVNCYSTFVSISGNSSNRNKSSTCVSRTFAICIIVSRFGWVVLVIHFDTVAWSLPNLSASHLLFKSRSARTTLILLSFAIWSCCQIIVECLIFIFAIKRWELSTVYDCCGLVVFGCKVTKTRWNINLFTQIFL